ncbi:MAG: hypothetical protein C3F07_05525 [Anaerolineales bacterium]|nr:PAS domain S-box protein [Anaerolineae bacterium]PWB75790.1 MAG: hypothetical protein C3F07_05525 [Anaerolineales bacterium]
MKFIRTILTPPLFEDETKRQQGYILHVILWALILVPIPYFIYALLWTPENIQRASIQALFAESVNILLLILMRRGQVKLASILQVGIFWSFLTVTAFTGSGVQGEAYLLGYTLIIAISGILLGGASALVFTLLSLGAGVVMVYVQAQGGISPGFVGSPLTTWIISLVLFPFGAILQNLGTRSVRQALARARASEERYRLISKVSSDYTFSTEVNAEGIMRLNWVAGAFEQITGYTYEEYVAEGGWYARLHPDDVEKDKRELDNLQRNKSITSEVRTFMKDGEIRWVRVYAHPVWDADKNQLRGIVGAVQDITERKITEDRETQRQAYLQKVLELGKRMTEVSSLRTTLEKIWQGVHDDLGFDRLGIFLYDQETNTVRGTLGTDNNGRIVEEWNYARSLDQDKPTSFTRALERPDGLFFTNDFSKEFEISNGHEMYNVKDFAAVSAWAGDKPVAIIAVDNHPSGRRITSEQLEALQLFGGYAGLAIQNAKLNTALEDELNHRQSLIDELEAKNAELEQFTYTVSHDLKSPLVTITGFLSFLEKDALEGRMDRIKSTVRRISSAAEKMQLLLNDLLELSRIGRLMNPPEDVPFETIVHEAIDHVRGRLDAVNAIVEIQRDFPVIRGDRARLVEVVQNLLDNAAKYSPPGVIPRIEIGTSGVNERGCPIFYVRDNGIGIEPQFHERIFGLFNKLDSQTEGTGVGLALVKRIIEVHNGRIWVESEKGKGTTFHFTLPLAQTKE